MSRAGERAAAARRRAEERREYEARIAAEMVKVERSGDGPWRYPTGELDATKAARREWDQRYRVALERFSSMDNEELAEARDDEALGGPELEAMNDELTDRGLDVTGEADAGDPFAGLDVPFTDESNGG